MNEPWMIEIDTLLSHGGTDLQIHELKMKYPEHSKQIEEYAIESYLPPACKGCEYIRNIGMEPCNRCLRQIKVSDRYKERIK